MLSSKPKSLGTVPQVKPGEGTDTYCVFCGIVRGAIEASVVAEDEVAVCVMDIQPVKSGHVLTSSSSSWPG